MKEIFILDKTVKLLLSRAYVS